MKKIDDSVEQRTSGLFIGSEPLGEPGYRSAAKQDDDDAGADRGDSGDSDGTDSDSTDGGGDSDLTDKGGDSDSKD